MKFEQFKNAMDGHFLQSGNILNNEWLFDSVEMVFRNSAKAQEQIGNFRVRPYNPPFTALLELIEGVLKDNDIYNDMPSTKQIEKYFNLYGYCFKEFLSPLTDEVVETRKELRENY